MKSIKNYTSDIAKRRYTFKIGYENMPRKNQRKLRNDMEAAFGWKTDRSFYQKMNGATTLGANEKDIIEHILRLHGIKWDYEIDNDTDKQRVPSN